MADDFTDHRAELDSPAGDAVVITPGASAMANRCRAIYVGGTGDLNVTTVGGTTTLFSAVPAGTIIPVRCTHILSTSTTATLIVAMF